MLIKEHSLDDLLHSTIDALLEEGEPIHPTKGWAIELFGVLLELENPRARLSKTYTKGNLFSCLGELLWYLAGNNRLDFIQYYIPRYGQYSDDGETVYGAYGPRLVSQIARVEQRLRSHVDTRKAVIQLFDATDIEAKHKDVPCTCTLQFALRHGRLHLHVNMRSNDVLIGLPHDVFAFTMLQEILSRAIGAEVGVYKHSVGSLHLYTDDFARAHQYLGEAWQDPFEEEMPEMPREPPWSSITTLLEAEAGFRQGRSFDFARSTLPEYWLDIIRLLEMYRLSKPNLVEDTTDPARLLQFFADIIARVGLPNPLARETVKRRRKLRRMAILKREMSTRVFDQYIHNREAKLLVGNRA